MVDGTNLPMAGWFWVLTDSDRQSAAAGGTGSASDEQGIRTMQATRPANALFAQDWTLDGLGNFGEFKEDTDGGGWDLDQDRTVSAANEIQTITGGPTWIAGMDPKNWTAG